MAVVLKRPSERAGGPPSSDRGTKRRLIEGGEHIGASNIGTRMNTPDPAPDAARPGKRPTARKDLPAKRKHTQGGGLASGYEENEVAPVPLHFSSHVRDRFCSVSRPSNQPPQLFGFSRVQLDLNILRPCPENAAGLRSGHAFGSGWERVTSALSTVRRGAADGEQQVTTASPLSSCSVAAHGPKTAQNRRPFGSRSIVRSLNS